MPTTKARLMRRVREYMLRWERRVGLDNELGLTDINKEAEDFYCGLLRIVLNAKLRNLNLLKMDFPAIDLADRDKRICVQVTSTEGREKIVHTLERFFAHHFEKDYDQLIILIIGRKKKYRDGLPSQDGFRFNPEQDVWDTARLILQINDLEMGRLRLVDAYLEEQLGPLTEQPAPLDLPLRTAMDANNFVGRESELAEIARRFETDRIVVLSGLGGMGKTELAVRFAQLYDRGEVYFAGFHRDFFHTVTDEIALGIEGLTEQKLDEEAKFKAAMAVLRKCSREDLLILDNADTEEASFEQLKREASVLPMRLLITTRCDAVGVIDVNALHREELHRIFRQYAPDIDVKDMDALIDEVDHHTLTVDLMARSMRPGRRAATPEKLMTALNKRDLTSESFMKVATNYPGGLKQARINEHLRAVFRVAELGGEEQEILRCATLLPNGGMNDELFMAPFVEEMQDVLDTLIQNGWLLWEDDLLRIHPVIRIVCREELKPTEKNCGAFLRRLSDWYDPDQYDKEKFRQLAELLSGASDEMEDLMGDWAHKAGQLWYELGEAQMSLYYNLKTVAKREKIQPDSEELAMAYNNVSGTYRVLGEHNKELEYLRKALEINEMILSPEDPFFAACYINMGIAYGALDDREKSLEYRRKAMVIFEKVSPPDHPDLARAYNNVGVAYGAQGDHEQALRYKQKALDILKKALPTNHPDLARSYSSVGHSYYILGNCVRALDNQQIALEIMMRALPPDHPDLAKASNNIACTYAAMGKHGRALKKYLEALEIWGKVLPEGHHDLVSCCRNIAAAYATMGNFSKASEFTDRALGHAECSDHQYPDLETYRNKAKVMRHYAMLQKQGIPFENPFKPK